MSDAKKVLVNHPDGRICEVPVEVLDRYVVPPERVKELTRQAGARATDAGDGATAAPAGETHSVVLPASGQAVVFNFYLGPQARLAMHQPEPGAAAKPAGADVEGYHMDLDAMGTMTMHGDWRVGPYIDKSGRPAFGPHSHDPVAGNAQ
jgi:hypothetical protein